MTTHTKGPWFIWQEEAVKKEGLTGEELRDELLDISDFSVYSGEPISITRGTLEGDCLHITNITDLEDANEDAETRLANARLIAAAPELLEALSLAWDILQNSDVRYFIRSMCGNSDPMERKVRAAIKKATEDK